VRRVEDVAGALWGARVSPSAVTNLNKKIYAKIEAWRNRPIEGEHPYVLLDGVVMRRTWAGEVRNVSLLVAIGVNGEGFREILGICEGAKEDRSGWSAFPPAPGGPRAQGRGADRLGRLPRPRRERRGVPAGRPLAALRRAFLPQRMGRAADLVDAHVGETLTHYAFPDCHWIKLRVVRGPWRERGSWRDLGPRWEKRQEQPNGACAVRRTQLP
jgi:putative transposase